MTAPGMDTERVARLEQAIRAKRAAARNRTPGLPSRPDAAPAEIGEPQRGLWFVHQRDPRSSAYNLASAFRLHGPLDVSRLERAFGEIVSRHRILRSTFLADGDLVVQTVHEQLPLRIEARAVGHGEGLAAAVREAREPFDLERGPLVRVRLIEETPGQERILLLVVHHILADERSLGLLWREVAGLYSGRQPEPAPASQYDDYAHWLRQVGLGSRDAELAYWRRQLDPLPDELRLPFEHPTDAPAGQGRLLVRSVAATVHEGVRRLATSAGVTPFTVCAFAFRLLLHRYTGGQRVAFATPVSTRSHPATADMIGYFLNPVVIRTEVDEEEDVDNAVRRFSEGLRDALAHASVPFDVLAANLSPPRHRDRHPLFQAMFVHQEIGAPPELDGARLEPVTLDLGVSKFDLTLFVADGADSLAIAVEYRADRFDEVWMQRLLEHYDVLLAQLPATSGRRLAEVPMTGAEEDTWIHSCEQGPALHLVTALLPERVLEQSRLQPSAEAVVCGKERQDYGELEGTARTIAFALAANGVRPDDRVGVFLGRSVGLIAGIVGIHWAGAAYVPLDPLYPQERTRSVLEDAEVSAVLTTSVLRGGLPHGPWAVVEIDAPLPGGGRGEPANLPATSAGSPAYILYTSGSTGRPKGVVVTHDNLRVSTAARLQAYDVKPGRFLLLPSVAFDSSVAGLFWTLASGGGLVVPTDEEARDVHRLAQLVARERVTGLLCVPSLYAQLIAAGGDHLRGLEMAIVAGESCPSRLVEEHFERLPHVRLWNEYGPTEATVWATVHEMTREDAKRPVPIGRPIPGVRVEVLDTHGRRVPAGVPGQGWIVGPTVAQGYWRRRDLTEERFIDAATGSDRRYRSGDRMAWTSDGRLLFLGRDDEQIKLRGFRIEPGEIEAALLEEPSIREAVVVARPLGTGTTAGASAGATHLVAFVVPRSSGGTPDWRASLARRLPDHMVPARLVEVTDLPRLPNGKVDRRRLCERPLDPETRAAWPQEVLTTREQGLVSLWEGLLGRFGIGVSDNFFERGGHSLLVMEMIAAVRRDFEVTLSASDVFEHPTVRELARRMEQRGGPQARPYAHLFPIQPGGAGTPFIVAIPHFFTEMLATRFRGERPVYGLRGVGLRAEGNRGRWPTMTALAEELLDEIRRRFPAGPYIMAGYSFGASMAFETVRLMEQREMPVSRLYLIAPMPLDFYRLGPFRLQIDGLRQPVAELSAREAMRRVARANHPLTRGPWRRAKQSLVVRPWRRLVCLAGQVRRRAGLPLTPGILHADVRVERFRLHGHYRPGPVNTPTVFFNAVGTDTDAAATWRPCFRGPLTVHGIPDPHDAASVEAAQRAIMGHLDDMGDA